MFARKAFNFLVYAFAAIGFILVTGYFAVRFGWTNAPSGIDLQTESFLKSQASSSTPSWAQGEEWRTLSAAVLKDKPDIERAANLAGIPGRLIVSELVAEQLRLFYTNRELFKTIFEPLKILGNQSQFSWGVMGIKQETAEAIEEHLRDASSPYYLGPSQANLLDFKTADHDQERFERIVNDQSRFYSYLYAGIFIRQIEKQWADAGHDISGRPGIIGTLFNIGFEHSQPKTDPKVGGSTLSIAGNIYSFGGLAAEFYDSSELISDFPR